METETLTVKQQAIRAMWQDYSRLMLNFHDNKELLDVSSSDIQRISSTVLTVISESLDLEPGQSY
jgi:hypothetical protein